MKRKLLSLKKEESTQTKMALVALLALVLGCLMVGNVVQAQDDVDISTWTAESYPAVSGFGAGVWTVAGDNLSVYQSVNGQPTLFYSDFLAFNTSFQGKIKVETTGDDDFIGFALGFQPGDTSNSSADYLLVDWKQGNQSFNFGSPSCTPGSFAPRGLAVSRVTGIPTADEFWGHTNFDSPACSDLNNGLQELQRGATLGSTGWVDNQEYEFKFEFSSTSLKVFVDGTLEIDITGSFSDGRIAFYNFSQASVRYRGFTVAPLCEPVEDPDVRTQGFWKRVCAKPHPSGEHENLPDYVDCVSSTDTFADVDSVDDLCDRLHPDPKNDKCQQAEAQFMALLLNVCSGRVATCNCIDDPYLGESTVGNVVDFIDFLLSNPDRTFDDCVLAQSIAAAINEGLTLVDCP